MSFQTSCPSCQGQFVLDDILANKNVRCGSCQTVFLAVVGAPVETPTVLPVTGIRGDLEMARPSPASEEPAARPPILRPAPSEPRSRRARPAPTTGDGRFVAVVCGAVGGALLLLIALIGFLWFAWSEDAIAPNGPVAMDAKAPRFDKDDVAVKGEGPKEVPPVMGDGVLRPGAGDRNDFDVLRDLLQKLDQDVAPPFVIDDKGVLKKPGLAKPAPGGKALPPANVTPLKITAAPATFDKAALKLPGTAARACLGGGGRFLILTIPSQRQLAVLDVNERKIVKYLPMAGDQPVIAAGLEKLVIAYPQQNIIQRWSLLSFEKEVTVNSPFAEPVRALCMGHASYGPLLVALQGERFRGGGMQFLALDALKVLDLGIENQRGDGHFLQASANGRYFCMRDGIGGEGHTVSMVALVDGAAQFKNSWDFGGSVLSPAPDGRFIYAQGGVYNTDLKKIHPQQGGPAGGFLPAAHGMYFLRLEPGGADRFGNGAATKPGKLAFYIAGNYTPLAHLDNVDGVTAENTSFGNGHDAMTHAERVHFIPNAKLVLSIPTTNDRVDVHRFDPEEAMEKAGIDYLIVTSDPPSFAQRGQRYAYPMVVKSKKGGVKVRLESGPDGMKLAGPRDLVWDVPANWADRDVTVIASVADASGQELFHTYKLSVVDKLPDHAPAPAARVEAPEPKKAAVAKIEPKVAPKDEPKIEKKAPPPGVNPLALTPPKLTEKVTRALPDTIADVAVGGGGRFLLFGMPKVRKIALFDVNEARIVHYFTMSGDDFRFSAGMSKLIVAYPDTRILQRWDLLTRERELTVNSPVTHDLHMVLMGSASQGPVLVGAGGYYSRGQNGFAFLDARTLKPSAFKDLGGNGHRGFITGYTRISADGTVIGSWEPSISPQGLQSYVFSGGAWQGYYEHDSVGHIVPGPDGKYLYTGSGVYTSQTKPIRGNGRGSYTVPSVQGDYFLLLTEKHMSIVMAGETRPLLDVSHILNEMGATGDGFNRWGRETFGNDKRLLFVPDAQVLVTVPFTNDKVHVYPIDIEGALDKLGVDYLYATSRPPAAIQGERFEYTIQVRSKKGGVRCKLESGPDGMKVSPAGVVTWHVPADAAAEQTVLITIQDASGQEIFHNFKLLPTAKGK